MAPVRPQDESDASMRARLVESLSQSFPGSALSRALHAMDEFSDTESTKDPLSSSCYAELRLDKVKKEELDFGDEDEEIEEAVEEEQYEDDDLKSLEWLQDSDLLKNIQAGNRGLCASPLDDDLQKENSAGTFGQPHPPHIPYNPQKHVNSKPPYSFSCLIFMAVEDNPQKMLPVKDIYNWILTHFPYFRNAPTGWKNSVRHNLSLNKCFKKVEKQKGHGLGKGSLWCIDPDYRPNLLQALRKTPYHPYHQLQMLSAPPNNNNYTVHGVIPTGMCSGRPLTLSPRTNVNAPSPRLFPFLSRRLAGVEPEILGDSDIDVANTLVSLKRAAQSRRPLSAQNGTRSRSPSPPEFGSKKEKELLRRKLRATRPHSPIILTVCPSEDHTYSVTEAQLREVADLCSPGSSPDEEYDFGEEDEEAEDSGNWEMAGSCSDMGDSDHGNDDNKDSDSDAAGGSNGEQTVVTAATTRKSPITSTATTQNTSSRKRKRKNSTPVPLYKKHLIDTDDEEEEEDEKKKIVEGADALLNLAGIATASLLPLKSSTTSPSSGSSSSRSRRKKRTPQKNRNSNINNNRNKKSNNNNNNSNNKNTSNSSSNNVSNSTKESEVKLRRSGRKVKRSRRRSID